MKKLMIDIDDTIVDQDGWLYPINKFLNTNYTIDDVKGYYIQDSLVPSDKKEEFLKYFVTFNTYDYSHIYPNCIEVIKKLNERFDLYICSSYVFKDDYNYSADALKYKFDFLIRNFPFIDPNRFIFATNKELLNCEIKIDDKVDNLKNADIKILYTAYHNKNLSDEYLKNNNIIRANNWLEVLEILDKEI